MRIRQMVGWGLVMVWAAGAAQAARLADGTPVHVRLTADLLSAQAAVGKRVDMEIAQPVTLQGVVVIPAGTVAWGAVQEVKKGKTLLFDVAGLRLPNQAIVKLRCSPQRTTHVTKDEIKVETQVRGDLGAAKGSEYTVYLDQDLNVEVGGAPAAPAPPNPAPAAAPVATPAPVTTRHPEAPATPPAPPTLAVAPAHPRPSAPTTPPAPAPAAPVAPAPAAHAAPAVPTGELITVECFSDPLGADIMIDDEFHGSTPSILKLVPGSHQIEYRLMGYKPHSQPLNLTVGTGLRTVRMTLEKQP